MPLYSSSLRLVDAGFLKDALEEGLRKMQFKSQN